MQVVEFLRVTLPSVLLNATLTFDLYIMWIKIQV